MNILLPFIAVILGGSMALFFKSPAVSRVKLLLAFSGGFLLSSVAAELLPDLYSDSDNEYIGMYIIAGVFLQIVLEFFSKGAEHGHLHIHQKTKRFPYLLFLSLCIHSFLEGLPLDSDSSLMYGIAVHKIPIAFIFASFLIHNNTNIWKSIGVLLLFAIVTPLGSLLASTTALFADHLTPIKAIVTGVILHISSTLILESSEHHKFNLAKILVILLGAILGFSV